MSGGAVSLEYVYPLDSTNAPYPTQSTDLIRTLFTQHANTFFRGPRTTEGPLSAVVQEGYTFVQASPSGTAITLRANAPLTPGNTWYVEFTADCGLGCTGNSFVVSDSQGDSFTQLQTVTGANTTPTWTGYTHAIGGVTTFTITPSNCADQPKPVATSMASCSGSSLTPDGSAEQSNVITTPAFQPVTTTLTNDTILGDMYVFNHGCTLAPGSGYGQISDYLPLGAARNEQFFAESTNVGAPSTFTPTVSNSCGTWNGTAITQAFTSPTFSDWETPTWDYVYYQDLVAGGDFPVIGIGNAGQSLGGGPDWNAHRSRWYFTRHSHEFHCGEPLAAIYYFSGDRDNDSSTQFQPEQRRRIHVLR